MWTSVKVNKLLVDIALKERRVPSIVKLYITSYIDMDYTSSSRMGVSDYFSCRQLFPSTSQVLKLFSTFFFFCNLAVFSIFGILWRLDSNHIQSFTNDLDRAHAPGKFSFVCRKLKPLISFLQSSEYSSLPWKRRYVDEQGCELNQCVLYIFYLHATGKLISSHHCPPWKNNINVNKADNTCLWNKKEPIWKRKTSGKVAHMYFLVYLLYSKLIRSSLNVTTEF